MIMGFRAYDVRICSVIVGAEHIKDIKVFGRVDVRPAFVAPVIVNAHIIGNTHGPLHELSFVVVFSPTERVNNFDKDLLKDIFSESSIFDEKIDGGVNFSLVAREENLRKACSSPSM
jgi:hypothetical protein